jgi:hypothetical protein
MSATFGIAKRRYRGHGPLLPRATRIHWFFGIPRGWQAFFWFDFRRLSNFQEAIGSVMHTLCGITAWTAALLRSESDLR